MSQVEASVEANDAAVPTANGTALRGGSPRRARRTVLSSVAPAMTGSATCRDSRLASLRGDRALRAGGKRGPVGGAPGDERARLAIPSASASQAPASVA